MDISRIHNDYFNNLISVDNNYTRNELLYLLSLTHQPKLDIGIYERIFSSEKYWSDHLNVSISNLDISIHGIVNDVDNNKQYVFNINGKYFCGRNSIMYCENECEYYSHYYDAKIFYRSQYVIIQFYGNKPKCSYHEVKFHPAYSNFVLTDQPFFTYDVMSLYRFKGLTDMDINKIKKIGFTKQNLFITMFSDYEVK